MRHAFARTLVDLAHEDPRIYLLVGDVGFGAFDTFAREFGPRYLNLGVAEANLAGISAGLALSGKLPFIYSIANFPSLRCLEQIRNDICYHRANVTIVTSGGGLAYGSLGATHHATEDLAVLRALPGMTLVVPADPWETAAATRAAYAHDGPVYLRMNRSGDPTIHAEDPYFVIGQAMVLREGADITLIGCGAILPNVLQAADELAAQGLSCRVLNMHTLKPIDDQAIVVAARETELLVTIEEHSVIGGLGSAVAEILAELEGQRARFTRLGLPDHFSHLVGSQDYLRAYHSLSTEGITRQVLACWRSRVTAGAAGA